MKKTMEEDENDGKENTNKTMHSRAHANFLILLAFAAEKTLTRMLV